MCTLLPCCLLVVLGGSRIGQPVVRLHPPPYIHLIPSPPQPILASGSWDGTVKMWNVFKKELIETHSHTSDVLAVAFRPDGKEVCM